MWGFGDNKNAYDQLNSNDQPVPEEHKAKFTHEMLGGAAAFMAMREYEKRENPDGNHQLAKEMLAGIAGAEVDRMAETKGLDFVDREEAKRHAKEQANQMYESQYVNQDGQYQQACQQGGGGQW